MGSRTGRCTSRQHRELVNAMTKYSDAEKAQILQESRDTLERLSTLQAPEEPLVEFPNTLPLDRWRSDALQRSEHQQRERTRRALSELEQRMEQRTERRIAAAIAQTRAELLEIISEMLPEFRQLLLDDMSNTHREVFDKLSQEVAKLRAAVAKREDKEIIDLPNPLPRRLQS